SPIPGRRRCTTDGRRLTRSSAYRLDPTRPDGGPITSFDGQLPSYPPLRSASPATRDLRINPVRSRSGTPSLPNTSAPVTPQKLPSASSATPSLFQPFKWSSPTHFPIIKLRSACSKNATSSAAATPPGQVSSGL